MARRTSFRPKVELIQAVLREHRLAPESLTGVSRSVYYGIRRGEARQPSAAENFCRSLSAAVREASGRTLNFTVDDLFDRADGPGDGLWAQACSPLPIPPAAHFKSPRFQSLTTLGDAAETLNVLAGLGPELLKGGKPPWRGLRLAEIPMLVGQLCAFAFFDLPPLQLSRWLDLARRIAAREGRADAYAGLSLNDGVLAGYLGYMDKAGDKLGALQAGPDLAASGIHNAALAARCDLALVLSYQGPAQRELAERLALEAIDTVDFDGPAARDMAEVDAALVLALSYLRGMQAESTLAEKPALHARMDRAMALLSGVLARNRDRPTDATARKLAAAAAGNLGALHYLLGEQTQAVALLNAAIRACHRDGHVLFEGYGHFDIALAYRAQGAEALMRWHAERAFDCFRRVHSPNALGCLDLLADPLPPGSLSPEIAAGIPMVNAETPEFFCFLHDDLCGSCATDIFFEPAG